MTTANDYDFYKIMCENALEAYPFEGAPEDRKSVV